MQAFLIECILLGLALSIDATVVSFSQGLVFTKNKRKNSTLLAFFVALFQFLFPIIGWWLATLIEGFVSGFANYPPFSWKVLIPEENPNLPPKYRYKGFIFEY